jgi:hypothetical protein
MVSFRQADNQELVDVLQYLVETYPDLRFSQIMNIWGFVKEERPAKHELSISWQNEFYVEPAVVIKRVKQRLENDV